MSKPKLDRIPTVDDFKLKKQQRDFHNRYTDEISDTRMNAYATAIACGYAESVAKSRSTDMVPGVGHTSDSARSLKPLPQAIFWTLYRQQMIRDRAQEKADAHLVDRTARRFVVTREFIEAKLLKIAERCMGEDVADDQGRDLAARMISDASVDIQAAVKKQDLNALYVIIGRLFREYCASYHVFNPAAAHAALKSLGVDIGMFAKKISLPPETPVDTITDLDELMKEERRLSAEFASVSKAIEQKRGKGDGRKSN